VDIIYTGTSFAGSDPQAAGYLRRALHGTRLQSLEGLSRQQAVPRHCQGLRGQDKHKIIALTYYGERMVTANKEIKKPRT